MTVCEDLGRKSVLDDILVLRVSDSGQNVEQNLRGGDAPGHLLRASSSSMDSQSGVPFQTSFPCQIHTYCSLRLYPKICSQFLRFSSASPAQHDEQPSQPGQVAQPACQRSSTELTVSGLGTWYCSFVTRGVFLTLIVFFTHIAFWSFGVVKSALRVTTNCINSTGCHVLGARHLFDP